MKTSIDLFHRHTLAAVLLGTSAFLLNACTNQPNELELEPQNHTFLGVGQNEWFKATPRVRKGQSFPKFAADVRWTSADPAIVTVDNHGRAQSVGAGSTVLKAVYQKMVYEVPVEVRVIDKIVLSVPSLNLALQGTEDDVVRTPHLIRAEVFDTLGRKIEGLFPVLKCKDENVCRTANDQVLPVDVGETSLLATLESAEIAIPVKVVSEFKKSRRSNTKGTISF